MFQKGKHTTGTVHTVYISIGSNVGKSIENCRKAISVLEETRHIELKKTSKFYQTEPVDYTEQAWFINAVIMINTTLEPAQLFNQLKIIEKKAGRERDGIRFGPRVLDLDIIFFDNVVLESSDLAIPHPRMHNRRFVLRPLCDINPDLVHPILNKTMADLLEDLPDQGQRIKEYT